MKTLRIAGLLMLVSLLSVAFMASTALAAGEISASRSFNATEISAGDTVRVTVDITVGGDVDLTTLSLDEDIPAGWTITEVDSNGWTYNAIEYQWLDSTGATISPGYTASIIYDLTSTTTSTGTYSISGLVGANTNEIPTTTLEPTVSGQTDITVTGGLAPGIHLYDGDNFLAAFANATDGEIIYLHEGTYDFTDEGMQFVMNPTILIIGDSSETVNISGTLLPMDSNTEVYLENLTWSGEIGTGILGTTCTNVTLKNCVMTSAPSLHGEFLVEDCTLDSITGDSCYGILRNNVIESFAIVNVPSGKSVLIENNYFNGSGRLKGGDGLQTIFRNNNVINDESGSSIKIGKSVAVTGNTFVGGDPAITVDAVGTTMNISIYENTFDSCTEALLFEGDSVATIYLNDFIDVSTVASCGQINTYYPFAASTWQSDAMDYTINGVTLNGPLGNYYSDYSGEDADSDGIGDTAVDFGDLGADSYPLMSQMENGGMTTMQVTEMTVDQVAGETYKFNPYDNPDEEYTIDSMNDFGLLIASGLDFEASDSWYAGYGSFLLDSLCGIENEAYDPAGDYYSWYLYIDGVYQMTGLGHDSHALSDDSVVSFYYTTSDPVTYEVDVAGSLYAVHLTANEIDYPVVAQRDIKNQNFYEELLSNYGLTSTQVTVTLTARDDLDSLTFEEVVPAGWTITSSDDADGVFKQNLSDSSRYEWVWTDDMDSGENKTVVYILTLPETAAEDEYPIEGTCSAYVDDSDVNGIPVVGEEIVYVSASDWNPWNDVDSDGAAYITTTELQAAINCWLNDLDTPTTGEPVTTNRLQLLVHYWVQNTECPEGADA